MPELKNIFRARLLQDALGAGFAAYLEWVKTTNQLRVEPTNLEQLANEHWPVILAMWHGQHFMAPLGMVIDRPIAVLVSRHGDGELNANVARRLGVGLIRGSGGRPQQMFRKGGLEAMHEMMRALESGVSVALTADRPKRARIAGAGVVRLAAYSGRPIIPYAVATSRRISFKNWDRSSIGLPYGRAAVVFEPHMSVAPDIDESGLEEKRRELEEGLDRAYRRAFAYVGGHDPGEALSRARSLLRSPIETAAQ